MSYLHDLAKRRPDLFNKAELSKMLAEDRFTSYVEDLTKREVEAVAKFKAEDVLNGRTTQLYLPLATGVAQGPK